MLKFFMIGKALSDEFSCMGTGQVVTPMSNRMQDHWLGAYRTNALYSGHIFVRFNDLEDVFT